jgi:hypothetical protein
VTDVTVLDDLAAYRVTRPIRALVLVPLPESVPWQVAMMVALRGQAATWGGSANLVVPWTDDLLERDELWAIASAVDPDIVAVARLSGADFAGIVGDRDPLLAAGEELGRVDRPRLEAVLSRFAERLPILQRNGQARPIFSGALGVGFPSIPVAAISGDLGPVSAFRCSEDLDLGLMLAAEAGDLADSAVAALARRNVVVTPHDLRPDNARDRVLRGPGRPGADGAWALSETGLRWLSAVSESLPPVSVVVGDTPWDFALGYALRRMNSLAWWLPTEVLADPFTVQWLLHRIDEIGDFFESGVVTSLSDRSSAESLAAELREATSDSRDWSAPDDVLALINEQPARLFSQAPGLQTIPVQNDETGHLPPDLPGVTEAPGQRIYWMAELLGENWQPLPDARLATRLVRWPSYDSSSARPTRSGVAYLCPNFLRMSDDMAAETVRPRIGVLDLREQLAAILAESGGRLEPSDKGQYAAGAANLFGGDDGLREALSKSVWWGALTALRSEVGPDQERRGWKLADRRTYYELAELESIRSENGLETDVQTLLERHILMRGLVFRCPLCRLKAWYGADELADRLRCARCREPFALTDRGWQPADEPQWRYRLNELLWQLLAHNGDVPMRALRNILGIGGREAHVPTASLHEQDLWEAGAATPIELDICAQRGPELWIGEAKVANSLGAEREAKTKLKGLRRAAQQLRPHGILFVTATEGWTGRTEQIALEVLEELPVELRFESCMRP